MHGNHGRSQRRGPGVKEQKRKEALERQELARQRRERNKSASNGVSVSGGAK